MSPKKVCCTCQFDTNADEKKKGIWCRCKGYEYNLPEENSNGECVKWKLVPGYGTNLHEDPKYSLRSDGKVKKK